MNRVKAPSTGATKILILSVVGLLPVRALGLGGLGALTPGIVLALLLIPDMFRALRGEKALWLLALFGVAAMLSAPLLTAISSHDHDVDMKTEYSYIVDLASALLMLGVLVWARARLGTGPVAGAFASGMILNLVMTPSVWSANGWKYGFAWPVAVVALSLFNRRKYPILSLAVLTVLALISAVSDYRSFVGFCMFVGLVFVWGRFRQFGRAVSPLSIAGIGVLAFGVYRLGEWMALTGLLGDRNLTVTESQIDTSGSVLAGARIEPYATFQLFANRPWGYGPGVVPSDADVSVGLSGITNAGIQPSWTYVHDYMFGDVIKLHSVTSDLWVSFGFAGVGLALFFGLMVLIGIYRRFIAGTASALLLFIATAALWDLLFSPFVSNFSEVILAFSMLVPLFQDGEAASLVMGQDSVSRLGARSAALIR